MRNDGIIKVTCNACGRTWGHGEALLLGRIAVCPHAINCNAQKDRAKLVRNYKRDHRVTSKDLRSRVK